jgi:hypothetical protein
MQEQDIAIPFPRAISTAALFLVYDECPYSNKITECCFVGFMNIVQIGSFTQQKLLLFIHPLG